MTTEQIIQRLLDEKHITVVEAVQMIKDLVRNEIFVPMFPTDERKTYPGNFIAVMYGVDANNIWYNSDNALHGSNSLSSDKPKKK